MQTPRFLNSVSSTIVIAWIFFGHSSAQMPQPLPVREVEPLVLAVLEDDGGVGQKTSR